MNRVDRYERRSEIPMLLLAGAFLVAYAWPVLDPTLILISDLRSIFCRGPFGQRSQWTSGFGYG